MVVRETFSWRGLLGMEHDGGITNLSKEEEFMKRLGSGIMAMAIIAATIVMLSGDGSTADSIFLS
jgi:hypothetical protein